MDIVLIQFWVLLGGTLFAWFNFGSELLNWKKGKIKCRSGRCSIKAPNPFLTPCFGGAVFFTAAFILNLVILFD